MALRTFRINRQILSEFLPDHDSIKQFENLFRLADAVAAGDIDVSAGSVDTDTSEFDGHLSDADTTVQKALDTLDELKTFKDHVEIIKHLIVGEYIKATEYIEAGTFFDIGIQNVNSVDTVAKGTVFCSGSDYTLTMPAVKNGRKVEVFNISSSGFITVSKVAGEDFKLYRGESLDMTCDGSNWYA